MYKLTIYVSLKKDVLDPQGKAISEAANSLGIINILDVIQLVSYILGTTFNESIEWLEQNFPELNTRERLNKLGEIK